MKSGIYTITAPSGNQYVGSAVDLERRWKRHKKDLRCGCHGNRNLLRASEKYGLDALRFERLLICAPGDLLMYEQRAIDALVPAYNLAKVAGSSLGIKRSEAFRKKISAALSRRIYTPEMRSAIGDRHRGKKTPTHVLVAMAEGRARKPQTKEQLRALARYTQTPEAYKKRVAALRGRPVSEETRQKIRESVRKSWITRRVNGA